MTQMGDALSFYKQDGETLEKVDDYPQQHSKISLPMIFIYIDLYI